MFPVSKTAAARLAGRIRKAGGRFQKMALLAAVLVSGAQAQWTYPGCDAVTDAHFKYDLVLKRGAAPDAGLDEPIKMAFDMDAAGKVDIYYVERKGKLKRFNAAAGTVETLGSLDVWHAGPYAKASAAVEEGLVGVALDPAFKANRTLYLMYSPKDENVFRISRFTLSGATLNLASEKILISVPSQREDCCHTGGAMAFDAYGDLWVGIGNNAGRAGSPRQMDEVNKYNSDEWGASSTAGLRGGILRIHPDNSARGYSIPKGNFWEHFAEVAEKAGNAALAADYRDSAKVKRQIYIKGIRNPYSLNLDPVRRWVMFGDVGPDDAGLLTEENNLFKQPAFAGWPYFSGNNIPYTGAKDPKAPTNNSKWNDGLKVLPPAEPGIHNYVKASAISGPIYRYDGDLASTVKLPPHFHRKWFVTDFVTNAIKVLTLDDAGDKVLKEEAIFKNIRPNRPVDLQLGPDGALYIINYAGWFNSNSETSIARISYTGTCRPSTPKIEQPVHAREGVGGPRGSSSLAHGWVLNMAGKAVVRVSGGSTGFLLFDSRGREVYSRRGLSGPVDAVLPDGLPRGILRIRWLK